ncbi:hypothetical protein DPEC_G00106770 [Dallia pectoralis]|uniref:Uncharacterized protein n=1 Tax=Dallia pectoralis TaxID=75939 RepID=A0ACC2GYZ3_DALPE|nr:hypothetical protein DPEC_G00106770 [Dallia pectoralis]
MSFIFTDNYFSKEISTFTQLRIYYLHSGRNKAELERAEAELEKQKAGLEGTVALLEGNVAQLEKQKAGLEGNVAQREKPKAGLEKQKAGLEGNVAQREKQKAGLESFKKKLLGDAGKTSACAEKHSLNCKDDLLNSPGMDTSAAGQKEKLKFASPVPIEKKSGHEEKERNRKEEGCKKKGNPFVGERRAWGSSGGETGGELTRVKTCVSVKKGDEQRKKEQTHKKSETVSEGKSSQSSRKNLKEAIQMAAEAQRVPLKKRLSRFGFWTRRASDRESSESEFAEVMGILLDDKKSKRSTNVKNQKPAVVKPFKRLHQQSDGEQTEPRKKTAREEKREKTEGQREKAEKQDKVVLKEVKEKMRGLQKSGVEEGRRRREGVERKKFCSLKPVKKTPSAPRPPDQTVPEIEEEAEEECGKAARKGGERKKLREKISQGEEDEGQEEDKGREEDEGQEEDERQEQFLDEDMEILGCREELMKNLAQENMEEDDFSLLQVEERDRGVR